MDLQFKILFVSALSTLLLIISSMALATAFIYNNSVASAVFAVVIFILAICITTVQAVGLWEHELNSSNDKKP